LKLGVFLPSYLLPGSEQRHGDQIRRFAMHAEELGFESLFITDHLLTAHRFYRVSWTEPLMTLAHAAAVAGKLHERHNGERQLKTENYLAQHQ